MNIHTQRLRLRLRPVVDSDLTELAQLHQDPEVMRFITGGRLQSLDTLRDQVLPALMRSYPCLGAPGFWAAETGETKEFVGWFELKPVEAESCEILELGYRLGRRGWGNGYATEGSKALVDVAFGEFGAHTVTANTMTVNAASRRVMEKCGLTYVRTFFTPFDGAAEGMEQGEVEYQLPRQRWEQERPSSPRATISRPKVTSRPRAPEPPSMRVPGAAAASTHSQGLYRTRVALAVPLRPS